MKHHHMLAVLLAFLFINIGLANALSVSDDFVNGVKLHVEGCMDMPQANPEEAAR